MSTRAQVVYMLIGLMAINTDAYKRQNVESNVTDVVAEKVILSITLPSENTTEYPPLKYWDFDVQCKFQSNGFPCINKGRPVTRWYFDIKMGDCKTFQSYKCRSNNQNEFKTYAECRSECRDLGPRPIAGNLPENAACLMQPDFGECQDYIPMFYFDVTKRRCLGFAFSGCGGNQNRFHDDKTCQTVCVAATHDMMSNSKHVRDDDDSV